MKAVLLIIVVVVVAIAVAVFFFGGDFGLFGNKGSGGEISSSTIESIVTEDEESAEENEIIIQVNGDEYSIDKEVISITSIENIIAEDEEMKIEFILEDNYGSAKAWDELKELFIKYNLSYTEK